MNQGIQSGSFDHDLNSFVSIGTGTVSEDGQVIKSDLGVGVLKAGWHGAAGPPPSGGGQNVNVQLQADQASVYVGETINLTASGVPSPGTYGDWTAILNGLLGNDPNNALMASCGSAATCSALAKFPGVWLPQVSFFAQSGSTATRAAAAVEIKPLIKLRGVGFINDIDIDKDRAGSAPVLITDPVWRDTNSPNNPVAYVRNTVMTVILNIEVLSPITRPLTNGTLRGNAQGVCVFQLANVQLNAGANTTSNIACDSPLPNTTKLYSPLNIQWTYTLNGRSYDLGSSSHKVYVTLAQPLEAPLYLSVLNLAVANGGASDERQAFAKSWARFGTGTGPANVTGWEGASRPFSYYPGTTIQACARDTLELLNTGKGRCGSFARLLVAVAKANGIVGADIWEVTPAVDQYFLVKEWNFGPPSRPVDPGGYKWIYRPPTMTNPPEMTPAPNGNRYGDITSLTGVPGQSVTTPSQKVFSNHALVRYSNTYYDPSYGKLYLSRNLLVSPEQDFQNQSVAGFVNVDAVSGALIVREPPASSRVFFRFFE